MADEVAELIRWSVADNCRIGCRAPRPIQSTVAGRCVRTVLQQGTRRFRTAGCSKDKALLVRRRWSADDAGRQLRHQWAARWSPHAIPSLDSDSPAPVLRLLLVLVRPRYRARCSIGSSPGRHPDRWSWATLARSATARHPCPSVNVTCEASPRQLWHHPGPKRDGASRGWPTALS